MAESQNTYVYVGRPGSSLDRLITSVAGAFIYLRSAVAKEQPVFEFNLDDYASQLIALLPRGVAFDSVADGIFGQLVYGIVAEFKRTSDQICILENETFPLNTTQLLDDWERAMGLPDACAQGPQGLPDRRAAVATKLATIAEPTPQFFVRLARNFGYSIEVIEYKPARVDRAKMGDPIYGPGSEFVWAVRIPGSYTQKRMATVSDARMGDPIATWGDGSLECLISQYKPAHTTLIFLYD